MGRAAEEPEEDEDSDLRGSLIGADWVASVGSLAKGEEDEEEEEREEDAEEGTALGALGDSVRRGIVKDWGFGIVPPVCFLGERGLLLVSLILKRNLSSSVFASFCLSTASFRRVLLFLHFLLLPQQSLMLWPIWLINNFFCVIYLQIMFA